MTPKPIFKETDSRKLHNSTGQGDQMTNTNPLVQLFQWEGYAKTGRSYPLKHQGPTPEN